MNCLKEKAKFALVICYWKR